MSQLLRSHQSDPATPLHAVWCSCQGNTEPEERRTFRMGTGAIEKHPVALCTTGEDLLVLLDGKASVLDDTVTCLNCKTRYMRRSRITRAEA